MLKQSPSRIQRTKMLKVKHVLQVFLLSAVCAWLVFQLKRSHYKKQEFDTNSGEISNEEELVKLGRKGLLFDERLGSSDEAVEESEEELELEYEFSDGEMRDEEDDEQETERVDEGDEGEEGKDSRGREEDSRLEREDSRGKAVEDGGDGEDEKQLTTLAKYDGRDDGSNDPHVGAEEIPNANQTVKGSARDKEELALSANNTEGSANGSEQVPVNSAVADSAANTVAKQNYSGSFESTRENATSFESGIHDDSERPSLDEPNEKPNTTISRDGSEDQPTLATKNSRDATPTVEDDRTDRPTLPAVENEVKNVKDRAAE